MKQKKDVLLKSRLGSKDVFGYEDQSDLYSLYRPTYPQTLISKAAQSTGEHSICLDVGCGTGQLSMPLSKLYKKVFGIDVSETQLKKAKEVLESDQSISNISYHFQNSHNIVELWKQEMQESKIDLVTFGQVLHWLDHDVIFSNYKEFMSEDSSFWVFSYAICSIMTDDMVNQIKKEIDTGSSKYDEISAKNFKEDAKYSDGEDQASDWFSKFYQIIKPHFECDREDVDTHYSNIEFNEYFSKVHKHLYYEVKSLTLNSFLMYLKSMSGYRCYLDKFPEQTDPLEDLMQELVKIYSLGESPDFNSKSIDIVYPYHSISLKY